jgi:ABC-type phosphate transport system permease subunit
MHAPNRSDTGFGSFFISSLERVKKQLKSLAVAAGHTTWGMINPLLLSAGPSKLPSAEILALIEEG